MLKAIAAVAALASLACASNALGAPCSGFTDVDSASPFCANVTWIHNRGVTLGCTSATLYCPDAAVSRLSMAAFLHRLGAALTPIELRQAQAPGAIDLDNATVVCQTGNLAVTGFNRLGVVDVTLSATAPGDLDFELQPVMMTNNNGFWQPLANGYTRTYVPANRWSSLSHVASVSIDAGFTVRFGMMPTRSFLPGTVDLSDSQCQLRVLLFNREET
jgi:hypothetical protein